MTTILLCLLITALIPYGLAFWASAERRQAFGKIDNHHPRQQYANLTGRGARLWAAQQNAWEALGLFTAAVVAVGLTGTTGALVVLASVIFVLARIGHALCYALDLATPRSIIFIVAFIAVLFMFATAIF
ncbi:MAPEG family protein [Salinicola aestuarinus]|uniref:MAPEG family protein n=1 Tax=Salinicola aestuarinus TaxID=1949082 RepID=UPI000DA18FD7|nr:MAPEG family protein [Salinicola aestuarinus]